MRKEEFARRRFRETCAVAVLVALFPTIVTGTLGCASGTIYSLADDGKVADCFAPDDDGTLPSDAAPRMDAASETDAGAGADGGTGPGADAGTDASVGFDAGGGPCTGDCSYTLPDCDLADVERTPSGSSWADSYSVDGKCYCATTFDHGIGDVVVPTPVGPKTVREVCEALGPGPGSAGNPLYNDVPCGNGPPNDAGDENWCPGRVDQGESGCCTAGPKWDFSEATW